MNSPSVVSMTVIPAVNSTGRQAIAYQGMCPEASSGALAPAVLSLAGTNRG